MDCISCLLGKYRLTLRTGAANAKPIASFLCSNTQATGFKMIPKCGGIAWKDRSRTRRGWNLLSLIILATWAQDRVRWQVWGRRP